MDGASACDPRPSSQSSEGLGLSAAAEALAQIYEDLCDNGRSCLLSLSAPWISWRNSIFISITESSDARVF